ncbi:Uncharacterised protein [Vibrio cholerae]|nr:Uncharacterised protein [Vibrio cholerae]CSI54601.1 Uncharacterised protein [Vibrio cholerae]
MAFLTRNGEVKIRSPCKVASDKRAIQIPVTGCDRVAKAVDQIGICGLDDFIDLL